MTVLRAVGMAFALYSRIPVPPLDWESGARRYTLYAFPLVGLAVGGGLLLWTWLAGALGLGQLLWAAGMTAIPLLITGGIHLDGFCDVCDALASHQSWERKLEILKDPHTGAFAVMGCMAYLLLTFALWTQPQGEFCLLAAKEMAVGYVFSRAMSAAAVVTFPCAKNSGLAHSFSSAAQKDRVRIISILFALVCAVCFVLIHPVLGAAILAGCLMVFWYYHHMAMKQFGGVTGDLAGWFLQVNEIVILIVSVVYSLVA